MFVFLAPFIYPCIGKEKITFPIWIFHTVPFTSQLQIEIENKIDEIIFLSWKWMIQLLLFITWWGWKIDYNQSHWIITNKFYSILLRTHELNVKKIENFNAWKIFRHFLLFPIHKLLMIFEINMILQIVASSFKGLHVK